MNSRQYLYFKELFISLNTPSYILEPSRTRTNPGNSGVLCHYDALTPHINIVTCDTELCWGDRVIYEHII